MLFYFIYKQPNTDPWISIEPNEKGRFDWARIEVVYEIYVASLIMKRRNWILRFYIPLLLSQSV